MPAPTRRPLSPGLWWPCLLLLAACAGPETLRLRTQTAAVELSSVPFHPQDDYQCGPAAVAMLLGADGIDVAPDDLVPEIYVPARQGSLQPEIVAALRRRGRVPYPLGSNIDAALTELRAGRPVLVLQNLGTRRLPVWHYAVLIGFDPVHQRFVLRSGHERRLQMPARRFLESWDRGGRWMLVVAEPAAPAASADAEGWLRAAAAFESLGELDTAVTAYSAATRRWPDAALAWAALGNGLAQRADWSAAESAYAKALALDAAAPLVRNNRAWTLAQLGCRAAALAEVDAGLIMAMPAQRDTLTATRAAIDALQVEAVCPL
jgi:tetratricopeptide (TPR) repeat protein